MLIYAKKYITKYIIQHGQHKIKRTESEQYICNFGKNDTNAYIHAYFETETYCLTVLYNN